MGFKSLSKDRLFFCAEPIFRDLKLDRTLTFRRHLTAQEVNNSRWAFEATSGIKLKCKYHSILHGHSCLGSLYSSGLHYCLITQCAHLPH